MKVYKATNSDMTCHMGQGVFAYKLGVTAYADVAKCGSTGLHACEYILDCLRYYGLNSNHRYFVAEATGDIAEDGTNTRISCTELTLLQELSNRDIAREALLYMRNHPKRNDWEIANGGVMVSKDSAFVTRTGGIAIARGKNPKVKGCEGSYLGLVRETAEGIVAIKLFAVEGPILSNTWYTIESAMKAIEKGAQHEEKTD